jgi:hypothetical protein
MIEFIHALKCSIAFLGSVVIIMQTIGVNLPMIGLLFLLMVVLMCRSMCSPVVPSRLRELNMSPSTSLG